MRCLHVIPGIAERYGGPSQAVIQMCRGLQALGAETAIATTDADGVGRMQVPHGEMENYSGVPTIFFERQWHEGFKYSSELARWLSKQVKQFDIVHVHAVFSHSSMAAARSCRQQGIPYFVRPLGSLDPWSLRRKRWRKNLLWILGVKSLLQRAAAIHYTTEAEKELAESCLHLPDGIVIPLGVDTALIEGSADAREFRRRRRELGDHPYVLILSRLHPKKCLHLLLEAFLQIANEEPFNRWRLVVAGSGESGYESQLKNLVKGRTAASRVIFTGWLSGSQRTAALAGAELLALTSHQENFGLSAAEALACGVPVMMNPQVNLASKVRSSGAGWLVELSTPAIAAGFRDILSHPGERRRRGQAGAQLARREFSWPAIARQLLASYELRVASCE